MDTHSKDFFSFFLFPGRTKGNSNSIYCTGSAYVVISLTLSSFFFFFGRLVDSRSLPAFGAVQCLSHDPFPKLPDPSVRAEQVMLCQACGACQTSQSA